MVANKTLELWVGIFVVAGVLALTMLSFKVGNLTSSDVGDGYNISARFSNIGQLKVKAPITLGGVRIGRVSNIHIDKNFYAVATLNISGQYNNLPKDTSAAILTAGLLGEQYVALEPGGDDAVLVDGDELSITQSAMVLEKLISQFLYNKAQETPAK